jgi:hypothetical protein
VTQPTTPFEPVREGENEPHAPLEPVPGQPPREVEEPEVKRRAASAVRAITPPALPATA